MTSAPFVLEQLEARGELVGAGASPADRAAEIVAQAEARAAEVEQAAKEAGLEIGRREGLAIAAAEAEQLRGLLQATIDALAAAQEEFVGAAELHAVELAVQIAEKVVGTALEVEPERVCDIVSGTLRRIAERDRIVLELNPDDVDLVRAWLEGEGQTWGRIEIHAERRVARGGCVARTPEGEIDARPSEQLAAVAELLKKTWTEAERA
jgi:flagellar biosynthesis/type III secretory pathway protein FliH